MPVRLSSSSGLRPKDSLFAATVSSGAKRRRVIVSCRERLSFSGVDDFDANERGLTGISNVSCSESLEEGVRGIPGVDGEVLTLGEGEMVSGGRGKSRVRPSMFTVSTGLC